MSQAEVAIAAGAVAELNIVAEHEHPATDPEVSDDDARPFIGPQNAPMGINALPGELIPVARAINFGAQTVINGQSSRDVIIAAGAALATANNNLRAARANRSVSRTASVTQEAAYAEVPRALPS